MHPEFKYRKYFPEIFENPMKKQALWYLRFFTFMELSLSYGVWRPDEQMDEWINKQMEGNLDTLDWYLTSYKN